MKAMKCMQVGSSKSAPTQLDAAVLQQAKLSEPETAHTNTNGKNARYCTADWLSQQPHDLLHALLMQQGNPVKQHLFLS